MKKTYTPDEILNAKKVFDYIEVKGRYYEFAQKDGQTILKLIPAKQVKEQIRKAKEMAKKLKDSLDAEKVLTEVFMTKFGKRDFDKLYNNLFKSKRKYKAKTREGACVDMKLGNIIIPIID